MRRSRFLSWKEVISLPERENGRKGGSTKEDRRQLAGVLQSADGLCRSRAQSGSKGIGDYRELSIPI